MGKEQMLTTEEINEVFETIEASPCYYQENTNNNELKFEGYTVDVFVNISASSN